MKTIKTWKKLLAVTIMATTVLSSLSGCGNGKTTATTAQNSQNEDTSLEDIKTKGELILGLDASFPPMGFTDESNEIVGYDIDLAKEVCSRMGIELKITPINWDAKEQELNTKNIDCIWNGFTSSPDRLEAMTLSKAYMKNRQVLVVKNDSPYQTLADLKGKIVELQKGSTAADAIESEENKAFKDSLKETVMIADNVKAMMDLGLGCDAVLMDEVVASYYLTKNEGTYRILDEALSEEEYVIGFRKGENALCDEIIKQLEAMKEDGTLSKIDNKWFGKDSSSL